MPRRITFTEEKEEEIPWFVRLNIPLQKVRQRLLEPPNHEWSPISPKEWNAFLERKRKGQLKVHRGANTTLRCPKCSQFLRHFYITKDLDVLDKAKDDERVHRLISGYICSFPCSQTFFPDHHGNLAQSTTPREES